MKRTLLSLIIFTITFFVNAQNLFIEYEMDIEPIDLNTEEAKDLSPQVLSYFKKQNRNNQYISQFLRVLVVSNGQEFSMAYSEVMSKDGIGQSDVGLAKGAFLNAKATYGNANNIYISKEKYPDYIVNVKEKEALDWQITSEQKEIAGHTCFKAIPKFKSDENKDKIYRLEYLWFSPALNYVATPSYFGTTLPGAVLGYKTGLAEVRAINIKDTPKNVSLISTDGKKILSYKEFNEFIAKKAKEFFGTN
ncbi:MAG: GLPGLI family protein [Psychroflexus maritimus]